MVNIIERRKFVLTAIDIAERARLDSCHARTVIDRARVKANNDAVDQIIGDLCALVRGKPRRINLGGHARSKATP